MISVIGAGPAGSYCAYLLAKKGFEVHVFEEHPKAGLPVQCTGIVTKNLFKYVPKSREFVINHFNKVQVVAPNNDYADIPLEEYLLDRAKFDNYLLNKALEAGAQVHFSHRFMGFKNNKAILKTKQGLVSSHANYFIGADGPNSSVAKAAGIFRKREFLVGMQARVRGHFSPHTFTTFFGSRIAPGFFAWVVPESITTARIGLATKNNTNYYFQNFIKALNFQPIEYQGGLIPVYNPKQKIQKDNIFLVGDAATFTKATTGGGLVMGLESGRILCKSVIKDGNYFKSIKKIKFSLRMHSLIRKNLNRLEDKDYVSLTKITNKKRVKNILKNGNREFPSMMILKMFLAEPRLIKFLKYTKN